MNHEHDEICLDSDVIDMGDDGDGYVAYDIIYCTVTGETVNGLR